jgi:hypothetical protein
VDLLPTMMDLMGLEKDPRHVGQSLVSSSFTPRRVFIGASNGPKYVGFIDGHTKLVVGRSTGLHELYDLEKDPEETQNLAEEYPKKTEQMTSEALAFADAQMVWLKNAPTMQDTIDVQRGLLDEAEVRVVKADGQVVPCTRPADSVGDGAVVDISGFDKLPYRRDCPGETTRSFLGARPLVIGRPHGCVLVNVPEGGGAVEIVLRDQPWQPFLTRIRAAVDRTRLSRNDEAIITAFGDGKQGQEKPIGAKTDTVRVTYPSSTHELVVRISGERPLAAPVCLTFTELAWRLPPEKTATISGKPPVAGAGQPMTWTGDEDDNTIHDDDGQGRKPGAPP